MTKNCDGGRFLQCVPGDVGENVLDEFVRFSAVFLMGDGTDETRVGFEVVAVIETATDETRRLFPYRVREF